MTGRLLAILAFHKIGAPPAGGWETWFYVPEHTLAGHLRVLQESGWQVIDVSTLLEGLDDPNRLPHRAALLTFDDGCRSMRTVTLPWLLRFGYPAVLFVPTDFIGTWNAFDAGTEPAEPMCDWNDLRELIRHGVSVQSHGASHRSFSDLDAIERQEELRRSKTTLEEGLGRPVEMFSFPYGDAGAPARATREALQCAGYRAACVYKGGVNAWPIADCYRLTRVPMGPDTDLRDVLDL